MAEKYSGGYGAHLISQFATRSLEREGAFLRPHLRSGLSVLDAGCGPGSMTVQIAELVAPGQVVGIDLDEAQFQIGRNLADQRGLSNLRLQIGNVYQLDFPDESFDVVFMHAVLYHLGEPQRALREARRVLKSGGLLAVRDADYGGDLHYPTNPCLERGWELISRVFERNGGNLFFGRQQKTALRQAGFTDLQPSANYDIFASPEELQGYADYWVEFLGRMNRDLIVGENWCPAQELEGICDAVQAWGGDPNSFYARARCQCLASKP
jgi:SAM-dependent methyltransferase